MYELLSGQRPFAGKSASEFKDEIQHRDPKPLPMRLDRWLVSQRPEQSRARIQKFIDAGYVRVNGITGRAKTPLRQNDTVELWMPPPEPTAW